MLTLEDKRAKPKKSTRWRWMALLLFAATTCGAGFWLAVTLNAGPAPELAAGEQDEAIYQLLDLEELYVNLRSNPAVDSPTDKLMRLRLAVVYNPTEMAQSDAGGIGTNRSLDLRRRISNEAPHIKDAFVSYLRQMTESDLEGSHGMEMLKSELVKRARLTVGHDGPQDVLISELIIQ